MATLSEPAKAFIVGTLACFHSPSEVVTLVKEELGLDVTRQQVMGYDPTKATGAQLGDKWRKLFFETRERFLERIEDIPIANRAVRLRKLQELIDRNKSPTLIAALLEQAAKESGGAYTNRRELTGKDGGAIQVASRPDLSQLTDEELAHLESLLDKAGPGDPHAGGGPG